MVRAARLRARYIAQRVSISHLSHQSIAVWVALLCAQLQARATMPSLLHLQVLPAVLIFRRWRTQELHFALCVRQIDIWCLFSHQVLISQTTQQLSTRVVLWWVLWRICSVQSRFLTANCLTVLRRYRLLKRVAIRWLLSVSSLCAMAAMLRLILQMTVQSMVAVSVWLWILQSLTRRVAQLRVTSQ